MRFNILQAIELSRDFELIRRAKGLVKNISEERQRTLGSVYFHKECRLRPCMLHVPVLLSGPIEALFSPKTPTALLDHKIILSLHKPRTDEYYDEDNSSNTASNPTFGFGSEVERVEDIEVKLLFEQLVSILEDYELRSTHNRTDFATCFNANQKTEKE